MDDTLDIGTYRPNEVTAILDCLRAGFGAERSVEAWRHLFLANPAGDPIIVLARDRGVVVGHSALLTRRLRAFGVEMLAGQSLWATSRPAWQRKGLSSTLGTEAARLAMERGFAAIYAFSNEQSVHGVLKYQARHAVRSLPVMVRPVRPLRAALALVTELGGRARRRENPTTRLLGSMTDSGITRGGKATDTPAGWDPPVFDERHTELFMRAEGLPPIAVVRDAAYLRWRYPPHAHSPYLRREVRSPAGVAAGVVVSVARPFGFRLAFVMEWMWRAGARRDALRLIHDAARLARAEGADAVAALAMPGTLHRRLFRRLGFVGVPSILFPGRLTLTVRPLEAEPGARRWLEPASWYLTWGDGDVV